MIRLNNIFIHLDGGDEAALPTLRSLVDDRTLRIWRLYLAGCAMGFARGWINIYQLLAVKGDAARAGLPLTREDLYRRRPD